MDGDINRDWKNVDWHVVSWDFDRRITASALVNGHQVRAYEFDTAHLPADAARLMDDMLAALKQHRSKR